MKELNPTKTPIQEIEQKHHDKIVGIIAEKIEAERRPAPHGWKLVPVDPTPEMLAAGKHTIKGADTTFEGMLAELAYRSMLAAAPTPPAQASGQAAPSDEEIEALALSSGLNKSDEHWGSRYYTELGSSLFRFARALLSRYGQAPAESADQVQALREALHAAAEYIGDRSAGSSTFWDLYDAALGKESKR